MTTTVADLDVAASAEPRNRALSFCVGWVKVKTRWTRELHRLGAGGGDRGGGADSDRADIDNAARYLERAGLAALVQIPGAKRGKALVLTGRGGKATYRGGFPDGA